MVPAHPQSGSSSTLESWSNWNLEMLVFEERGKQENQQQTQKRMASTPGFEPGPHWWEASALTTASSLASQKTDMEKRVRPEKES